MTAVATQETLHQSFWSQAWLKFKSDRAGTIGASIVLLFLIIALGVWLGVWGVSWSDTSDDLWSPPSIEHWFGTNMIGQDVFTRTIYSTTVAFEVGLVVTLLATLLGTALGAVSGYFSGSVVQISPSYSGGSSELQILKLGYSSSPKYRRKQPEAKGFVQ